jgi:hypothetical protein
MKQARMLIHPVLGNSRSRLILFSYFVVTAISSGISWGLTLRALKSADILIFYQTFHPSWYVGLLTSPIVHMAVSALAALIGATLTSTYVIGPIKRLEQWLQDWDAGHKLPPFNVRKRDYLYENIASLINQLHEKNAPR